jgi:lipid A 3-O-deacylase
MTGPSAQGEAAQDGVHRVFGRSRFQGWDNQLRDEVLVQVQHERLRRWHRSDYGDAMAWDVIGHAGGALGNLATFANTGVELRWGKHLPDDFGTDPLRPAGDNTAPGPKPDLGEAWGWHFFAGLDARWTFHDITLDGNSWKDSHSVDKREAVADLSLGVAITRGRWKIAGSHIRRSREFVGQKSRPVFGTVTVTRSF